MVSDTLKDTLAGTFGGITQVLVGQCVASNKAI